MAGAWTTPITMTPGHVVTAAEWNSNVRDNSLWVESLHGCSLYLTADQTGIVTSTRTAIGWGAELYDTDGFHDTITNNTRITIPTGLQGDYRFMPQVTWDSDNTGQRRVAVRKNGDNTSTGMLGVATNASVSGIFSQQLIVDGYLNAGDYVEVMVWQSSGTNRLVSAQFTWDGTNAATASQCIVQWLGA